jgi:mannose-6-phosphate isomerase
MPEVYPLLFEPVLKSYIWGGKKLEKLGRDIAGYERVAESWEISGHEDGATPVINGIYAGKTLLDLLDILGEDLIGKKNTWALEQGKFPWLVKLIDAHEKLSVQVHPDDAYALAHEANELGKTEMWVVLEANPGSEIIYGLSQNINREQFHMAIVDGKLEPYLHKVKVKAGDHICVPSRTLHAILEGVVLVEIQQNSNVTYRVYDWNRLGKDGHPRPLMIDKALDVINFEQVGLSLPEAVSVERREGFSRELLCQNEYFTTERYVVKAGETITGICDGSTLEVWGVISGAVEIDKHQVNAITFFLLPASLGSFEIKVLKSSTLLRTYQA